MFDNLLKLKEQIQHLWNNFDKKVKVIISVSIIITIVLLFWLANWASQPEYTVLFNNLSVKDAGSIVNKLKEKQISYQLKGNGTTVLVPKKEVYQLRLDLASEGLPSGGVAGFEIFDRSQIGSTDFEQKVNFYRALSGELTRTIKQLNKVDYAKVQVTPTKTSIYKAKEKPAKASVLLKLKEYEELSKKEIRSIVNLVASSVNGLNSDKVTLVDTAGNLLSAKLEQEDEEEFASDQLELKNRLEETIEEDLNVMLTKVLGMNNFVIKVNTELNFDRRNIQTKTYEPVVGDEGIVRSEQVKEESSKGTSTSPEGVPGTTSNLPQYKIDNQKQTNHKKEERIVNYEINEQTEEYTQVPGSIEKLSVSLMVNQKLDPQKKKAITQAISTAVGYDSNRGDQITVTGIEFDNTLEETTQQEIAAIEARRQKILLSLIAIVAGLILIVVILLYRKRKSKEDDIEAGQNIDYVIDEAQEEFAVSDELTEEEKERQELQNNLRNIIKDQPEEIAELIKSWLAED